jgi:hypothetical protein
LFSALKKIENTVGRSSGERVFVMSILENTTLGSSGSFADRLGAHISQRLAEQRAISLAK